MATDPMTPAARLAESRRGPARGPSPKGRLVLGYALVTPIIAVMVIAIVFPVANALVMSVQDQRTIGSSETFAGFANYAKVLGDERFAAALGRSGLWLALNMVVQTLLAFVAAFLMQGRGFWARSARTWIVLPWAIPTVAVAVIWQWMLNSNYGVIHKLFGSLGIDLGAPFGNPSWALFAIILVNSWHWFPLSAVVVYGALATVPPEVLEAAKVDGANAWQTFRAVTFPVLSPVLFALGLVGSLWSVNILDSIYLITEGGPSGATTTLPVYVYDKAFSAFRASEAAAASVLTCLTLIVAATLFVRFAKPKED
ncbi:MAG: sugar ABC transporter permease [Bifidobacteriaceae bacterium]|jgi:multiple sugar transport system permease protein|nr:sugar ABC transporter permease [Bifidobacteriaceae bacterium]